MWCCLMVCEAKSEICEENESQENKVLIHHLDYWIIEKSEIMQQTKASLLLYYWKTVVQLQQSNWRRSVLFLWSYIISSAVSKE